MTVYRRRALVAAALIAAVSGLLSASAVTAGTSAAAGVPAARANTVVGLRANVPMSAWSAGGLSAVPNKPMAVAIPRQSPLSGNAFRHIGGCTFYATSFGAGGWCGPSGDIGHVPSLRAYLDGRTFIPCKFFPVPPGMAIEAPAPNDGQGGKFFLRVCIDMTKVDPDAPWTTEKPVDVFAQWVPNGNPPELPPYMEQIWGQQQYSGQYPMPRIIIQPVAEPRVNVPSWFSIFWVDPNNPQQRLPSSFDKYYNSPTAGRLDLHAELEDVVIDPGVAGMKDLHCGNGNLEYDTAKPPEPAQQHSKCWTVYQHSSATADGIRVQMAITAVWHVEVRGGRQVWNMGDHEYTVHQLIAVVEVQPENVPVTGW